MSDVYEPMVVPPDPVRAIEGLRDTGYSFVTAVADIVDNSIAAQAAVVDIRVGLEYDGSPFVQIADNGVGMDHNTLIAGMRYGSPARPNPRSLGKFGMGLKTASTSLCRQLTVTSRGLAGGPIEAAQWDLDFVAEAGEWYLRFPSPEAEDARLLDENAREGTGTVVAWRKVDRLIKDYRDPTGAHAKKAVDAAVEELKSHLGVTYSRFLDGTTGPSPVVIRVNGSEVRAWEPLCLDIGAELLIDKRIPVQISDGTSAHFRLRASVLPARNDLSKEDEDRADISADGAGFYVYREDRCISAGGWLRMFKEEPHSSLCRIDFSFGHELDSAFQIDIKKSRIEMLHDLVEYIKKEIGPARSEAERRYRQNRTEVVVATTGSRHDASNKALTTGIAAKLGAGTEVEIGAPGSGAVTVKNPQGVFQIQLPESSIGDEGVHVEAVESTADGLLFEPRFFGLNRRGVGLNAGHPFYQRCYLSNEPSVVKQALDFLLWSLVETELRNLGSTEDQAFMRNLRQHLSSMTRELAERLPEPEEP